MAENETVATLEFADTKTAPLAAVSKGGRRDLARFARAVDISKKLLDLPADWDGAGSPEICREAWRKAMAFVLETVRRYPARRLDALPAPCISAGPEGSVDVHWRTEHREILFNFPAQEQLAPNYYGDNYAAETIKGTLDISINNISLLHWLIRGHTL